MIFLICIEFLWHKIGAPLKAFTILVIKNSQIVCPGTIIWTPQTFAFILPVEPFALLLIPARTY